MCPTFTRRQLDLDCFARGDVAFDDRVGRHLRPPAVAVAIAGGAIGRSRALGAFVGMIDLNSVNFSASSDRSARRPSGVDAQIMPLPSTSIVTAPPSGDMPCRRLIDRDLVGARIELAERPAARVHVEPEIAVGVAHEAVRVRGLPVCCIRP